MRIIRFQEEVRNETASIAAAIEYALWTLNRNVIAYIDLPRTFQRPASPSPISAAHHSSPRNQHPDLTASSAGSARNMWASLLFPPQCVLSLVVFCHQILVSVFRWSTCGRSRPEIWHKRSQRSGELNHESLVEQIQNQNWCCEYLSVFIVGIRLYPKRFQVTGIPAGHHLQENNFSNIKKNTLVAT